MADILSRIFFIRDVLTNPGNFGISVINGVKSLKILDFLVFENKKRP